MADTMTADFANINSVDDIVVLLDTTTDRAELIALLAPMRVPHALPKSQRARLTAALMRATARCLKFPA
jgi:hypothetical protein